MDKIIIINQDKEIGSILAEKLRGKGAHVLVATNELEALSAIHPNSAATVVKRDEQPIDYIHHPDFDFGPFKLIFTRVQLLKEGTPIPLSYMECKLLMYLVLHREKVVSTQDLMRMVWGYGETVSSGTIYTHISWLRKKLKTPQKPSGYISTIRNMGYIFSEG